MYRHSAEAIKESSRKKFLSQDQINKYNAYEETFIEKEDSYTKQEIDEFMGCVKNISVPSKDRLLYANNASQGYITNIEVYGDTNQRVDISTISKQLENGALDSNNGGMIDADNHSRTSFIEVAFGDEYDISNPLYESQNYLNIFLYDSNKNFIKVLGVLQNFKIEDENVKYMKLYADSVRMNSVVITLIRRHLEDIISVGEASDAGYTVDISAYKNSLVNIGTVEWIKTGGIDSYLETVVTNMVVGENSVTAHVSEPGRGVGYVYKALKAGWHTIVAEGENIYFVGMWSRTKQTFIPAEVITTGNLIAVRCKLDEGELITVDHKAIEAGNISVSHIQIESGNRAIEKKECIKSSTSVNLPVQLEKVGNVSDRLFRRNDGVWCIEKNIKTGILNGSEELSQVERNGEVLTSGYIIAWTVFNDLKDVGNDIINIISDQLVGITPKHDNDAIAYESEFISGYKGSQSEKNKNWIYIKYNTSRLSDVTMNGLKSYISENNITFKYISNTPEIIELPLETQLILESFEGDLYVMVESNDRLNPQIKCNIPLNVTGTIDSINDRVEELNQNVNSIKKLDRNSYISGESDKKSGNVLLDSSVKGFVEDIKIEGETLVNLHKSEQEYTFAVSPSVDVNSYTGYSSERFTSLTITEKLTSWGYLLAGSVPTNLKNNTKYTVYIGKLKGVDWITFSTGSADNHVSNSAQLTADGTTVVVLETNSKCEDILKTLGGRIYVYFTVRNGAVGEYYVGDVMILEGDHTDKPLSFFENIKSVEGEELKVISSTKNLFVKENCKVGYYQNCDLITNDFKLVSNNDWVVTEDIPVKPNMEYYTNMTGVFLDINKNVIESIRVENNVKTIIPNNAYYVRLNIYKSTYENESVKLFLVEYKYLDDVYDNYSLGTRHERSLVYYDHNEDVYKNITVLRGIHGAKDSIEKHGDGKYYYHKRCEEILLDGSETWDLTGANYSNDEYTLFVLPVGVYTTQKNVGKHKAKGCCVSNLFNYDINGVHSNTYYAEGISMDTNIDVKVANNKFSEVSVSNFKTWLSTNNLRIVYELKEEEVYEILPIDLVSYNDGTIINLHGNDIIQPHIHAIARGHVSDVVSGIRDRLSSIENVMLEQIIFQNKMLLLSNYSADASSLKVDISTMSTFSECNEDYELYSLIYKNIITGVNYYDKTQMEEIIDFYTLTGRLTFDMAEELFRIIESQHSSL